MANLEAPAKPSSATRIIGLVLDEHVELFHDADLRAFAVVPLADVWRTWPLRGKTFTAWAKGLFYKAEGKAAGAQAVADAVAVLESKALFEGNERPVPVRVAEHEGNVYLDLANEAWETVLVRPGEWLISRNPPVRFRRPRALWPLPKPALHNPGPAPDLRKFVNIADPHWRLVFAWTLFALTARGPFPVLIFRGGQGSGKSWVARVLKSLIDPNLAPLRSAPREPRDLAIAANNSWLLVFDNLSTIPEWLSDSLCQLATGGGFSTRELYSDGDEAVFAYTRPVVLTSIEDVATRGDLLERSLIVALPAIPEDERLAEQELREEFERNRPALLGLLLSALAATLRQLPNVRPPALLRMADFTRFGIAAERALGWPAGSFLEAYRANRQIANNIALADSVLPPLIRKLLDACQDATWEGSGTELLDHLGALAGDQARFSKEWPKKPHSLSGKLRRLAPNLEAEGIQVTFDRDGSATRSRTIKICRIPEPAAGGASEASRAAEAWPDQDASDALDTPPAF